MRITDKEIEEKIRPMALRLVKFGGILGRCIFIPYCFCYGVVLYIKGKTLEGY